MRARDRSRLRSEWFKIFLRLCLIVANLLVVILGIIICVVGGLSIHNTDPLVGIIGHHYNGIPVLMIVLGSLVCVFGLVGSIGGIFVQYLCGRIILRVYGFLLALLIAIEIIGGIAAVIESENVKLDEKIKKSFLEYNNDTDVKDTWDRVQEFLNCCGVSSDTSRGYEAYELLLGIEPPKSCCLDINDCNTSNGYDLYESDCISVITNWVGDILSISSIVIITFALLQIFGVAVACFISVYDRRDRRREYDTVRDNETSYLFPT